MCRTKSHKIIIKKIITMSNIAFPTWRKRSVNDGDLDFSSFQFLADVKDVILVEADDAIAGTYVVKVLCVKRHNVTFVYELDLNRNSSRNCFGFQRDA